MRPTKFKTLILVVMLVASTIVGSATSWAAFNDIDQNWAKDSILSLEERGLFNGLWAEEFNPHSPLTHVNALELVTRAFQLTKSENQELAKWLGDLLVGHPEGITRGEFAALVANLVGLGKHSKAPAGFYPSFADLNLDYPGFLGVEVLQRLSLLPSHMLGRFEPYRLITRSEVAFILDRALSLEKIEGVVADVQGEGKQIVVQIPGSTDELVVHLLAETLYVAPQALMKDAITTEQQLVAGDHVVVLAREKNALLINVDKETTAQALLQGINNATRALAEILTPAQVSALVAGDWEQLNEEVRYELYEELVNRGIAPWEADALLKQDWSNLQIMAQERLTQEAADYLKVTPELVHAAVSQDWSKLLEYAQVELAQRLLTSDWLKSNTNN